MAVFTKKVTVKFHEQDEAALKQWLDVDWIDPEKLGDLECEVKVTVEIKEFDDQDIIDEYEHRFKPDADTIGDVYRLLAEGDLDAAMHLMSCEFDLQHPDHERKVWQKVAAGRAREPRHVQG